MHWRLIATVVLATVMCVVGCQKKADEAPPAGQPAQAKDAPAAVPVEVDGAWTIVAHHMPETGAMSEADADKWIGRTVHFSATEAASDDAHCSNPSYTRITMARNDLLGMDIGFPQGALLRLANNDPLTLVNVSCDGQPLATLGRLLIVVDSDHILAPWESVYFELARNVDANTR